MQVVTTESIWDALRAARGFFVFHGGLEHEPATNENQILLRELEHALSILFNSPESENIRKIHGSLVSGELVAECIDGRTISKRAWPSRTNDHGSYWFVSVPHSNAVEGFEGKLIFVPVSAATQWLLNERKARMLNPEREGREEFWRFVLACGGPHSVTESQRDEWSKMRLRGGRDAGRKIWNEGKPEGASRPGRKRRRT